MALELADIREDLVGAEKAAFLWGRKTGIIPDDGLTTADWPTWGELALALYRLAEALEKKI